MAASTGDVMATGQEGESSGHFTATPLTLDSLTCQIGVAQGPRAKAISAPSFPLICPQNKW
jgi:hypothetical protein